MPPGKIALVFPKDSEGFFCPRSGKTFGGATVNMARTAEILQTHMPDVSVLGVMPGASGGIPDGFPDYFVPTPGRTVFSRGMALREVLKREQVTCVAQHGLAWESIWLMRLCRSLGIAFCFWLAHDREAEGRRQRDGKKIASAAQLYGQADYVWVQNTSQQQLLHQTFGREADIVPPPPFEPFESRGTDAGFLWIARCDGVKRPEVFLDIVESLPDVPFTMVCPPAGYPELFARVQMRAKMLPNLTFRAFVPFEETFDLFARARAFISTSEWEGYPLAFAQAVAGGVPILSLTVDPGEMLSRGGAGICMKGEKDQLRNRIQTMQKEEDFCCDLRTAVRSYAPKNAPLLWSGHIQRLLSHN